MRSLLACLLALPAFAQPETPKAHDPRLTVTLFAAAPDIVQPIATDFDSKGRLLVVESHTHFRLGNYKGPAKDRVRMLEDTDGDGKADKFTTFFEGTTHTMDLAVHFDGSVFVATRNEILRLHDTDGDGKADKQERIAFLDTAGNYPHNGLAGLSFDSKGNLFFGMGENLGAGYKLSGADGTTLTGGGEGGNFYTISADGKGLRRIATGFWNPFGSCRDIFGRVFVVDNDPDSSPPCRLLHIVEGGDYGYQFRYGRSGRHPFQAWNGELPGTLPMVAGTGESPCEVIAYESDGLPKEYLGDLLVPAWADHRLERYTPENTDLGVKAIRKPFVQGGKEFHPSGLTVAPDGSLFVSDWGSKSYELHGKGAVWQVRWKDAPKTVRPNAAKEALRSGHRPLRDSAARRLAPTEEGLAFLKAELKSKDVRVRASAIQGLADQPNNTVDWSNAAVVEQDSLLLAMLVRIMARDGLDTRSYLSADQNTVVRLSAIEGKLIRSFVERAKPELSELLNSPNPYLRQAAVRRLSWPPFNEENNLPPSLKSSELLIAKAIDPTDGRKRLTFYLADKDPEVRFLAYKWIADEKVPGFEALIARALTRPDLDPREFLALSTARARLEGKPVSEDSLAAYFLERLVDPKTPAATKALALRGIPTSYAKLKTETLTALLKEEDEKLRLEALRALTERNDAKARPAIGELLTEASGTSNSLKAQAILALQGTNDEALTHLANSSEERVRREALRGLAGSKSNKRVGRLVDEEDGNLMARAMGKPFFKPRPAATDTTAWLKLLEGEFDIDAGRRIFENTKLVSCATCHRADGRGANVGPDLSLIGRTERKWIVESILQPSAVIAPHYQAWKVDTNDAKSRTGLLVHTNLDETFYIDANGSRFKVEAKDVDQVSAAKESIMPEKLLDLLTDQEIRDLVAYLASRR